MVPDSLPPWLSGIALSEEEKAATTPPEPQTLVCSARGCTAVATAALRWNNPKVHTPDRRKTWLACPQHEESLTSFLSARGFMRSVDPVEVPPK